MAEQKDTLDFATIATNLTPAEKAEYLALVKMFESDGWRLMSEHLTSVQTGAQIAFNYAESWDINRYYRGFMDSLEQILAYETYADDFYAQLATEHIGDTEPADQHEESAREML